MITKIRIEFAICKEVAGRAYYLQSLINGIVWCRTYNSNTHLVPTERSAWAIIEYHNLGFKCYVKAKRV